MSSPPSDRSEAATKAEGSRASPGRTKSERPSQRPGGAESLIGTVLSGRYLIERLIGEGGMGAVYLAEHTHIRKRVAVKVLHAEMSRLPEVVARFEREAMAAAHIEHPNVAAATDFGKLDDGSFFLVLEYVEGRSLREVIADGPIEVGRTVAVVRQIAGALGRAHALGIVHRDLKPENVMLVTRDGNSDFAKVLDFGIAKVPVGELVGETKAPGQALTQLGMVYGTPEYMAPEQALGQPVDARADLYALGVIMFEMLAGVRPYEHSSKVTLLGMHVTAPIPRVLDRAPEVAVPEVIEAIVTRLLAKESAARYADAKDLVAALDDATFDLEGTGSGVDSNPASRARPPIPSSVRIASPGVGSHSTLAVGPTSLAQPATTAAASRGLASLVGASLSQAFKAAPPWLTPRRLALAGSALGVLLLGVVVVAASARGGSTGTEATSTSDSVSVPEKPADPKTDDIVSAAEAKIDKGDFATAIDALTAVEKTGRDRADEHQLLERAYTGVRNSREAMREAGLWLAVDPNASADAKLQEDVRNAALFKEAQDDAFNLLESKMGTLGIDILYDIAFGTSGKQYPQAAGRARHSLETDTVRSRASAQLAILFDFREAKTCESKRALLDRARDFGDVRMLLMLQPYLATRGCGFLSRFDCYPCLHRDSTLRDTMAAIEERAR